LRAQCGDSYLNKLNCWHHTHNEEVVSKYLNPQPGLAKNHSQDGANLSTYMSENFLKQIREEKKISQSDLAQKIGVSKQLLSGFEKGRSGVSNEVLKKLSEVLEVSPDAILTGKSSRPFDEKGRQQLTEAMSLAFRVYGDQFDKEILIKIATEVYAFTVDLDLAKTDLSKNKLKNSLEEKILSGLAAKCFLDSNNKF
jgi:transcriptional regulator with XRE-family HTH domain